MWMGAGLWRRREARGGEWGSRVNGGEGLWCVTVYIWSVVGVSCVLVRGAGRDARRERASEPSVVHAYGAKLRMRAAEAARRHVDRTGRFWPRRYGWEEHALHGVRWRAAS